MVEPVGLTLGAISLLEPAFKLCLEGYRLYEGTRKYNHEYRKALRKLRGRATYPAANAGEIRTGRLAGEAR